MRTTKIIKKKALAVMTVVCLLAGSISTFAKNSDDNNGVLCDDGYVEYTEYPSADEDMQVYEISVEGTRSTGYISNWSIATGHSGASVAFKAYNGGEITAGVTVSPANKTIKLGIVQPDGTRRYVSGSGAVGHTFSLSQSGNYKVYVANDSGVTVTVNGSYVY